MDDDLTEEVEAAVRRLVWSTKVDMTHAEFARACRAACLLGFVAGLSFCVGVVLVAWSTI